MLQCVAVCGSVLQCVVVCCSVLQCVAVRCKCCDVLQCVTACCDEFYCGAVGCHWSEPPTRHKISEISEISDIPESDLFIWKTHFGLGEISGMSFLRL